MQPREARRIEPQRVEPPRIEMPRPQMPHSPAPDVQRRGGERERDFRRLRGPGERD